MTPLGYRIPSSRMPGSTFEQPHQRERRADHEPSRAQRVDRVFAAGGSESARRHPGGRHVRAVELDTEDQCPRGAERMVLPLVLGAVMRASRHRRGRPRSRQGRRRTDPRRWERRREEVRAWPGPTGPACRVPANPRSPSPEEHAARRRCSRELARRGRHRYDEAGVRLDVESPPARQPCSRRARNGDRRHSPRTRTYHARERESPGPAAPDGDRDGRYRKSPCGDAVDTAQVTPRAPVYEIRR